jgi:hypothetical protein
MLDSWHGGYDRPGDVPAHSGGGGGERPRKLTKIQYDELQKRRHKDGRPMTPYLDGRIVLRLQCRDGRSALETLLETAPVFWDDLRSSIGSERAHRFKPQSWGTRGYFVLVVIAVDEDLLRTWLPHDRTQLVRRLERGDARDLNEQIPSDVADAIHLATFPDGPRAVQELLDHLEKLDDDGDKVDPVTGMTVRDVDARVPALGGRARHLAMPLAAHPSPNRKRFAAAVALAEVVHGSMSASDRAQVRITGVTLTGTNAIVSIAPTEVMLSRPLREALSRHATIEPARIDVDMAQSLHDRFDMALRQQDIGNSALSKASTLRPATYRAAVRSGLGIHGVTVILLGLVWFFGPWALGTILPVAGLAAIINLGLLPPLLRWGPTALEGARDAVPRIGSAAMGLVPAGMIPTRRPDPIDPWALLERLAPRETDRIEAARAKCDRLLAFADGRMPSQETIDAINSVQIHLPEMVGNAVALAAEARPDERAAVVARALAVMDGVAAAADDARDGLLADARDRFSTTAGFLEARTSTNLTIRDQRA